jgi:SAM-dependent methyltransferase
VTTEKYDDQAATWTADAYADPAGYLAHRAALVASLGPPLVAGDTVLDLACGDAGLAGQLLERGLRYAGVDLSAAMVEAARSRFGDRIDVAEGDLNTYEPPRAVACTTCFRAVYYAPDRRAFFRHVAAFTEKKLVFDLNPRQFAVADVVCDLEASGLARVGLHPFFAPQRVGVPRPLASGLRALEGSGPLARALLRVRFTYLVVAAPR